MGVINIVKSYPEIFGRVKTDLDEEDAWRIIASVQSHGSILDQVSLLKYTKFNAVQNLFQLGLRDEAVALSKELLQYVIKYQVYTIAQQLCRLLVEDSTLENEMTSVVKYNQLYRIYSEIIEMEYQAKLFFGELIHNHYKGIETNEIEIIRSLSQLKEKLPCNNLIYHYYNHSCQLILASESDYEDRLLSAIRYFENMHFRHDRYLSPFVIKLVLYYQKNDQYNEAEILINRHLRSCKEGSTLWFKYLKIACLLYFMRGDLTLAKNCMDSAFGNEKFHGLSDREKADWNQFRTAL